MAWILLGIPLGIALLYFGSEWMVDGAKNLALRLGVTPFAVGLTVVAFGSSAPEFATCVMSSEAPSLILGNVVGSNIANVGLAIGLVALLTPVVSGFRAIRFEMWSMLAVMAMVAFFAADGEISKTEGLALMLSLFVFVFLALMLKKPDGGPAPGCRGAEGWKGSLAFQSALVLTGIVFLFVGAKAFIGGARELAASLGASEFVVGLLVVALGTSLPEFCICVMAGIKGENEILVSNIVGSIIFNCTFALGAGAMLVDIPVPDSALFLHIPVMVTFAAAMFLCVRARDGIGRVAGAAMLLAYVAYVFSLGLFPGLA
ncbi:MAG: calcium/sodium antiporter [Thermoplasmatales archaeon]|nr:calcium/sodium antiporter [Thermoplasmatales archaeon]